MVMRAWGKLYLIEMKLDKSAEAAVRQIDLKDYASRFSLTGLSTVKVGINLDTEERAISDWKIECVDSPGVADRAAPPARAAADARRIRGCSRSTVPCAPFLNSPAYTVCPAT